MELLKALPLFEAANAAGAAEPAFKDLHQLKLAAPELMPAAALEDSFVLANAPGQRAALACLGVEMLSHSAVIRCARMSSLVPYVHLDDACDTCYCPTQSIFIAALVLVV